MFRCGSFYEENVSLTHVPLISIFLCIRYSEDMEKLSGVCVCVLILFLFVHVADDSRINTWKSELSKLDQAIEVHAHLFAVNTHTHSLVGPSFTYFRDTCTSPRDWRGAN